MKIIGILFLTIILISCSQEKNPQNEFIDKVVDLVIETSSDELIQFPNLYDSLSHGVPDDTNEHVILVEKLKDRGFEISQWGRGNFHPLGPRIISIELTKGKCVCEVTKTYYSTTIDPLFHMTEGLKCRKMEQLVP